MGCSSSNNPTGPAKGRKDRYQGIVQNLGLEMIPLEMSPKRGFYKEAFRGKNTVAYNSKQEQRNAYNITLYVVASTIANHWHKVDADAMYFYHEGWPVVHHIL